MRIQSEEEEGDEAGDAGDAADEDDTSKKYVVDGVSTIPEPLEQLSM